LQGHRAADARLVATWEGVEMGDWIAEIDWIWIVFAVALVVPLADIAWFTFAGPRMVADKDSEKWSKKTWFQQYLFNFLGCVIGWAALLFVIYRVILDGNLHDFAVWDALGVLVAFLGVTGYLPIFIMQIVDWRGTGRADFRHLALPLISPQGTTRRGRKRQALKPQQTDVGGKEVGEKGNNVDEKK
jgi:hypothetical protein